MTDLDRLRDAVSIADVLLAAGYEPPQRGQRTKCPIHGGHNVQAFSIRNRRWNCWNCGAHGDVFDLVQGLHRCDFMSAVAHVSRLARFSEAPQLDADIAASRKATSVLRQTRRQDLERDMIQTAVDLYQCDQDARWVGDTLRGAAMWEYLAKIYTHRDSLDAHDTALSDEYRMRHD